MAIRQFPPRLGVVNTRRVQLPPKQVDLIYTTPEYKRWRELVISRAHGHCQDPAHDASKETGPLLYADHVVELKDGGAPFDPSNGLVRCASCHTRKTASERGFRSRK